MTERAVREIIKARPSRDGDGVAIQRVSGMRHKGMDPILMLDELRSDFREDFQGGFPPHPHRGMQTLTYMKRGGLIHEDSLGNRGEIRGGGAQWMSAGRGVIHSEMPTQDTTGLQGFQLWFNLPAKDKMSAPQYRDLPLAELAQRDIAGGQVTAIAGDWLINDQRLTAPLTNVSASGAVLDLELQSQASVKLGDLLGANVLVYVYAGVWVEQGEQRRQEIAARQMVVTGEGANLTITAGEEGLAALVLSGQAIGESVANYGPFVMNTRAEIEQAIEDYQAGRFTA